MEKYFDASYIWESIPVLTPFLKVTFMVARFIRIIWNFSRFYPSGGENREK